MSNKKLSDLLSALKEETSENVTIEEVVRKFEDSGFGPLMLFPSLIALLPTGGIPGVPSVCGITLFCVCLQIAFGRSHPWLPDFIKRRSINHEKLANAVDKSLPVAKKIEKVTSPRVEKVTVSPWSRVIALYSGIVSLCMIPLEALPFAVAFPAFALSVTALGITSRDGIVVIVGVLLQAGTGFLLFRVV